MHTITELRYRDLAEKLGINKKDRKRLKSVYKEQLVKRSAIKKIVTAWIVTVPCSAALAASIFFLIRPWIVA